MIIYVTELSSLPPNQNTLYLLWLFEVDVEYRENLWYFIYI